MKVKVFLCTFLCFTLLAGGLALAAVNEADVSPLYDYATYVQASLEISGGTATVESRAKAIGYDISTTTCLQRKMDDRWVTIKTWNRSGNSSAFLSETRALTQGYTYRSYVKVKIYDQDGNVIETAKKYSNSKKY